MNPKKYTYFLSVCLLIFVSCKKDPGTGYEGSDLGLPNNLLTPDAISSTLLSFTQTTLPEQTSIKNTNPELLTTNAIADIEINTQSDVFITFISQGAANANTLAFYTYPLNKRPATIADIGNISYIFPNAGYLTALKKGDKVKIGRFDAGTTIGFVLLQNGWDATTHTINNNVVHFFSNDVLNPEVDSSLKKHAVLINYPAENKILIGFEDTDRTKPNCDNDFNDLLFYCTATP